MNNLNLRVLMALLVIGSAAHAQYDLSPTKPNTKFQTGISAKATIEFQKSIPNLRLGINAGIASPVLSNILYPAVNLEWQIYYRGLGTTSGSPLKRSNLTTDLMASAMMTGGINYRFNKLTDEQLSHRNQPLYYFTDLAQPALQNPYRYSMSVGTNFLIALDPHKKRIQQIGYVNLHVSAFQFNYYNDGGGFQSICIGDGEDRYFTGGGFAAVNLDNRQQINQMIISYHKFSGFTPESFDLAGDMDLSFVSYANPNEAYYNKSYWNFAISNVSNGFTGFFRINNPYNQVDFQNTIHYTGNDAYHQIPYPKYYSIGGSFFKSTTQIGTK
jgi:hypothetical protein